MIRFDKYIGIFIIILCSHCSKLVEVAPPITNTNGDNVFNEDANAIAVLTGVYTNMSSSSIASTNGWLTNICFVTGLTGDELSLYNPSDPGYGPYLNNNIPIGDLTWSNIYNMIFVANSAIEKLPQGTSLTLSVRQQLMGEAKFLRALCYFYLVNIYGDVPLATTTDYQRNRLLGRSPISNIYDLIISDLIEAKGLLSSNYLSKTLTSNTSERVRPTKWAAIALLSRVYLFTEDYVNAEAQATSIIDNTTDYQLVELDNVFTKNNSEAIWQLQPVGLEIDKLANAQEGILFNLFPISGNYTVYLRKDFVHSFDLNDLRRIRWMNYVLDNGDTLFFSYKYKIGSEAVPTSEYSTVLRLGEQYLIRAEARVNLGKIKDGVSDLNKLRLRATNITAPESQRLEPLSDNLSQKEALSAVELERKFELFTEWGHRWLDLKRMGRIDAVLSKIKPNYQGTDKLFPIPQPDISKNPSLIGHQNPGYN